ncbi:Glyoxalase/Bleomycin resistance protein/Dihydroxybiphenyl dioxygenase [Acephala macrosclerotiorum]|nr:Glyoxalase/Bleomycin resistance protein/Dihydroxybiphenyl dioxygenase [Acephala macrosclerotiorum]
MPIAHISLPVSSLSASTAFYLAALKPLGYDVFMKHENTVGLTIKYDGPDFWLHYCPETGNEKGISKTHIAFKGNSQKAVREFYQAALKAGAKDNGPPGERPQYTKGYYAAYVLDLDGNNVECVYYQPWWLSALQVAPSMVGGLAVAGLAWWGGRAGWGL